MNKHLAVVKTILENKKKAATAKLAQASLSAEQKTQLENVMAQIDEAISALEAATAEATAEQIAEIFAKAVETLSAITDQSVAQVQNDVQAMINKLQAKIELNQRAKKVSARLSFKKMREAAKGDEGFKPYSAGVDVTAFTPEAEIEDLEVFHPLIGVTQGFDISTTAVTSIKLRKMGVTGSAAVVVNHGVKPLIEMVGAQNVVNVSTIAGIVENIADEDLEDNPGLESEVQQEALTNLGQFENAGAIALLAAQGQAFANANFGTKVYADELTALVAIIDQVRQALGNRQSPVVLALNSSQWAKLKDLRSPYGNPLDVMGSIGDVIQVTDNTITGDNFYCWAKSALKIKIYKAKAAEWYKGLHVTGNGTAVTAVYSEWRTDESSLRVRQRQVMYCTDNTLVVKGTISGVVGAVTAQP
jgi:hypothetical protein